MERTDELLLEAYREGDESAFPELLQRYKGHTYPEVAAIMGCSLGSVKTHMSRALKTLSTRLPEGGVL